MKQTKTEREQFRKFIQEYDQLWPLFTGRGGCPGKKFTIFKGTTCDSCHQTTITFEQGDNKIEINYNSFVKAVECIVKNKKMFVNPRKRETTIRLTL